MGFRWDLYHYRVQHFVGVPKKSKLLQKYEKYKDFRRGKLYFLEIHDFMKNFPPIFTNLCVANHEEKSSS